MITSIERTSIAALADIQKEIYHIQKKLVSGTKFVDASDYTPSYWLSKSLSQSAADLLVKKDTLAMDIVNTTEKITKYETAISYLYLMKSNAELALESSKFERDEYAEIHDQNLVLVNSFVDENLNTNQANDWDANNPNTGYDNIQNDLEDIEKDIAVLEAKVDGFKLSLETTNTRSDYLQRLSDIQIDGAEKLSGIDVVEETVKMIALETRYQLALRGLNLIQDMNRSILELFA